MAEEIRLEVTRADGYVWLNRVIGGQVIGSLWMPPAEWEAFAAELTGPRGHGEWTVTGWCTWWGGEDPNDCAGQLVYDDQAEAQEMAQWILGGRVAKRTTVHGPWIDQPEGGE
jgi:hypothetical protein